MTKTNLFFVCLGLSLAAGACAPEDGPAAPGYDADVKPIFMANCVRCHGQGDKLNADPGLTGMLKGKVPVLSYLDHYEDRPTCGGGTTLCRGAMANAAAISLYIVNTDYDRMPPKPSDPLSDREIGIIQRWAAEKPTPKP